MAGKAGRSGGARPGSGRKPKAKPLAAVEEQEPLAFLLAVMLDPSVSPHLRVRAAICAAQYKHTKSHDGGKKDREQDAAQQVAGGKFSPGSPPKVLPFKTKSTEGDSQ